MGLGQEDFAHRAGLHRTHISVIERGLRSPTLAVVEKLAAALSTSMAALLEETGNVAAKDVDAEEPKLRPGRKKKRPEQSRPGK